MESLEILCFILLSQGISLLFTYLFIFNLIGFHIHIIDSSFVFLWDSCICKRVCLWVHIL